MTSDQQEMRGKGGEVGDGGRDGHSKGEAGDEKRQKFCQSLYYFLGNCVKVNFASIG